MSARFSTSHELHLPIARSRLGPALVIVYYGCQLWAMVVLLLGGHVLAPLLLCGACLLSLCRAGRSTPEIQGIGWRGGRWCLMYPEHRIDVEVDGTGGCPPWFFTVSWRHCGEDRRTRLWLFCDQLADRDWRRLLARLKLSG